MRAESSNADVAARTTINTFCDKWLEEGGRQSVICGIQGHLQLRDNQDKYFRQLSARENVPRRWRCIACDFGEVRTIPTGPERTVEKWFAHERLGVSVYVCRCWTREDDAWYLLVNNITEKTTSYALECLRAVLDEQPWTDFDVLSCWSDGPAKPGVVAQCP